MLRQAVKSFLHQQNRLSFSSLQRMVRYIQTLNHPQPSYNSTLIKKIYYEKSCFRYIHFTSVYENVQKKVKKKSKKTSPLHKDDTGGDNKLADSLIKDENKTDEMLKEEMVRLEDTMNGTILNACSDKTHVSETNTDDNLINALIPSEGRFMKEVQQKPDGSVVPADVYYRPKSVVQTLLDEKKRKRKRVRTETDSKLAKLEEQHQLKLVDKGEIEVHGVDKVPIPALTSVAPIVNDSEVLRNLVDLGVNLAVVAKNDMINTILKMDFKRDVSAYIWFLKDSGAPAEQIGEIITRCPWIFQHDIHNLRVRIDYLRSKKFTKDQIANMLEKDPKFLLIPVDRIDAKLGVLQKEFELTGNEIRQVVSSVSKLIIAKPSLIMDTKFYLKKFLGFTESELKTMFLTYPKIYFYNVNMIAKRFDYLHNVMELPHEIIAKTPQAMQKRQQTLESRHRFLVKLGRAQYDPTKPNYVSLNALISETDEYWCLNVAKASVVEFNEFLRLI